MSKKPSPKPRWQFFAHPAFSETLDTLVGEVKRLRAADAAAYKQHPKTKLLKRIVDLIETENSARSGRERIQSWQRAGACAPALAGGEVSQGRFRLFFRYSSKANVIIYAWVNDENTLRKAGGRNDPYSVFGGLLRKGRPPDDWDALAKEAATLKVPPETT